MATHSNILAWEIPWTEEPSGLSSPQDLKELDIETKQEQQHSTVCVYCSLFFHSPAEGYLCAFRFWQLWIKLPQTSVCRFLYRLKISTPLSKCQGVLLLGHMLRICLVLKEITKLSSKITVQFCISTSNEQESWLLHILISIWYQCSGFVILLITVIKLDFETCELVVIRVCQYVAIISHNLRWNYKVCLLLLF